MKKFLFAVTFALCAVSCFNDDDLKNTVEYVLGATFEYNQFDMQTMFGSDSLYFDETYGLGMAWSDLAFYHKLDESKKEHKGGFFLSCVRGDVFGPEYTATERDMYKANAPKDSTSTYMVYVQSDAMPAHDIEFLSDQLGTCHMSGCLVTVPVAVADSASKHFKDGDRLLLKATGYNADKKTGEVSINLINFTEAKDSIVSNWTVFDMSKLGDIQYVEFELESSVPEVPTVFCMDNMVAKVDISF